MTDAGLVSSAAPAMVAITTEPTDRTCVAPATVDLLQVPPAHADGELFEDLLRRPGVRIERIVSRGHVTPPDRPYRQGWDEWVLVLRGRAELALDGIGNRILEAGTALLIPAGVAHRVTATDDPTVWLAIHVGEPGA